VSIGARAGRPWITVPKLAKQPEPANLERIKAAVQARWGTVDLLDFLAEADHHIDLIDCFPSIATSETMPAATLRERLLLVLFALGTNTGIKHVADGDHGHSEAALRHVRRLFVTKQNLRRAIATLVNANYAARDPKLWGAGTACASDSKKFGSWESNLMTEWHARLPRPRRDDLLARREGSAVRVQPTQVLLLLRRRDDGRPAAPRHGRADRGQLCRHSRRLRHRLRLHPPARLLAAAQVEEHRRGPPLPLGG
jgi:hypothetical protein